MKTVRLNLTNTRDKCQTKYDNYMVIGDLNYFLLCPITNNRDKCLTKYDNYMVIGDLNYDLLSPITNTRDKCLDYIQQLHGDR